MKLKFEVNVPRPTGTWTIKKWNLLKGETEVDGVEVTQNNLITNEAIIRGYFKTGADNPTIHYNTLGTQRGSVVLSRDETTPVASSLETEAQADVIVSSGMRGDFLPASPTRTNTYYFWSTGAPSNVNGEVIKSLKYFGDGISILAWLKLSSPVIVNEGDVIKVTYSFSGDFPQATSTGKLTPKIYAYGEDPDNPAHGTDGTEVDYTLTTVRDTRGGLTLSNRMSRKDEIIVNQDGSLEWTLVGGHKSATSSVSGNATNITSIVVREGGGGTTSTLRLTGTLPQQTPGSYYELEIEVTYKVAAP